MAQVRAATLLKGTAAALCGSQANREHKALLFGTVQSESLSTAFVCSSSRLCCY